MDLARLAIPKYDEHYDQCKRNKFRWKHIDNFIFKLLPFLREFFVQDDMCRTLAYTAHQTSLHVITFYQDMLNGLIIND